ncbi:MAG: PDDEXK nuclease domain-containing protein [Bacteroidota bacterium]
MNPEYTSLLAELKTTIQAARLHAIRQVNRSLILMYWELGRRIVVSQERHGWGKQIVDELSKDLQQMFPQTKGLSARNLWYMRQLYLTYKDYPDLQQSVAEIPWGHNVVLLAKKFTPEAREYYLTKSAQFGWTRTVLEHQISVNLYERQRLKEKTNNFKRTVPEHLLEQANEAIKSSYNLEFLGVEEEINEADLEKRLIDRISNFLLELGFGFAFLGKQYRLSVAETDFWVDLLFYHRHLKCLIAIDLKATKFKPEYLGKMNFYLNVLDDKVRLPEENPSLGIILCKEQDDVMVEYSLRGHTRPMGVSTYQLFEELPAEMREKLPTPAQLREQLRLEEE